MSDGMLQLPDAPCERRDAGRGALPEDRPPGLRPLRRAVQDGVGPRLQGRLDVMARRVAGARSTSPRASSTAASAPSTTARAAATPSRAANSPMAGAWHTAVVEWTPGRITFLLDDQQFGTTTSEVPGMPMNWILQSETSLDGPPPNGTSANIYVRTGSRPGRRPERRVRPPDRGGRTSLTTGGRRRTLSGPVRRPVPPVDPGEGVDSVAEEVAARARRRRRRRGRVDRAPRDPGRLAVER